MDITKQSDEYLEQLKTTNDKLHAALDRLEALGEDLSMFHREHLENCAVCSLDARCSRGKWFCEALAAFPE